MPGTLELRAAPYDHPDALLLTNRVQAFYVEIYGGPDSDPIGAEQFTAPHGGFLLGYLDGVPVAMGGWTLARDREPPTAHLRRMYVDPGVRRHGLGRALLAALEDDAARRGVRRMILTTGLPQAEAIALYRAAGYAAIAPYGHYADSDSAVYLGKAL
ncbi:MAG TPA: GNAT family N-acetyltransferase [Microlunatus sp.]|nr:GNAT family N-acetyltransferase [Microlunatus sp.]